MRRHSALALIATLALVGCSAPASSTTAPPSSTEAETTTTPAEVETTPEPEPTIEEPEPTEPETGPHGHLVKVVGEDAGIGNQADPESDDWPLRFTVDEIVTDFECDYERPDPPANGQFIGIQMTATTNADWMQTAGVEFEFTMHDVVAFVGDTRVNDVVGNAALCLDNGSVFPRIGSGQNATGWVVIDVPEDVTSVAFVPFWGEGLGWEWQIP